MTPQPERRVDEIARNIALRIIDWCDDDRASLVILGSLSAELTRLCRSTAPAAALFDLESGVLR